MSALPRGKGASGSNVGRSGSISQNGSSQDQLSRMGYLRIIAQNGSSQDHFSEARRNRVFSGSFLQKVLRAAHTTLWECVCMAREQPLLCITPGSRPQGDSAARMLRARVCTYPTLYVSFGVVSES